MPADNLMALLTGKGEAKSDDAAEQRAALVKSSRKWLEKGLYSRVFGELSIANNESDLVATRRLFYTRPLIGDPRLRKVMRVMAGGEHYEFIQADDVQRVLNLVDAMVQRACSELLDERGQIKRELVYLLEWNDFRAVLQDTQKTLHIIHSYVEALIGGLWTAITNDSRHLKGKDYQHLTQLMAAVTSTANANYRDYIMACQTAYHQDNVVDDCVNQLVAALPANLTPKAELQGWIRRDLNLAAEYGQLKHEYITFWIHAMLESLAARRFDVTIVILNTLAMCDVDEEMLQGELKREFLFCRDSLKQMDKSQYVMKNLEIKGETNDLNPALQVLAQRDCLLAEMAILGEHVAIPLSQRHFMDNKIISQVVATLGDTSDLSTQSLSAKLAALHTECKLSGYKETHKLLQIITKYETFFQGNSIKEALKSGVSPVVDSDAARMQKMGFRRSVSDTSGNDTLPVQPLGGIRKSSK